MTEAEWLTGSDPMPLVRYLKGKVSDRKLRLFVVASCRAIWPLLELEPSRRAVEAGEQYADGLLDEGNRIAIRRNARLVAEMLQQGSRSPHSVFLATTAAEATWPCVDKQVRIWGLNYLRSVTAAAAILTAKFGDGQQTGPLDKKADLDTANRFHANLLRDIFGNPFRPVTFDPDWRTSTAVALAQQMYDSRDFSLMPILADAIQDAGCEHPDILAHCRGPGPHVRGCWVVDHVLGME